MFNNVSWQGYWLAMAFITIGYYLTIYLLYFRTDFQILIKRTSGHDENDIPLFFPGNSIEEQMENATPSIFEGVAEPPLPPYGTDEYLLEAFIDELNAFFEGTKHSKIVKEELIYSLQMILLKYPAIKTPDNKMALMNLIFVQCKNICSIHLSKEDVVRVWAGS